MARLILDTGVLVAAVRGRPDLSVLADTDDLAVPALVLAEFEAGVPLDDRAGRAAAQRAVLDGFVEIAPVIDHDRPVARRHAALLAHTRTTGRPREPRDLIVAATAIVAGRELLTTDDRGRFADLPDMTVRHVAG